MIASHTQNDRPKTAAIEAAIAAHGAWAVLFAAASALLRGRIRKARPPDADGLNAWMRADIGLPPRAPRPDWRSQGLAAFQRH